MDRRVQEMRQKAIAAKLHAYAPFSHFSVGAAVLTADGEVYAGCNVESASYSLSLCAERVALFKGISQGERQFRSLAVVADTPHPVLPCGACRQVMAEWISPESTIHLGGGNGEWRLVTMQELLPEAFRLEGSR